MEKIGEELIFWVVQSKYVVNAEWARVIGVVS